MAKNKPVDLRKKAEEKFRVKTEEQNNLSSIDLNHLTQELQIHKIELEMQNEELKRAQRELEKYSEKALSNGHRQNEFLGSILEHSNQPFGVGYTDGRLGLVNKAFEELTGYTRDELRQIDWSATLTPPEWRESERIKLDELLRTRQPVRYEKEYVRKDGSRVPIELLVHLITDPSGNPEYFYSFITDITERKRAEEAIRRQAELLWLSFDAIIVWQLDGTIESWNRGAEELYGFTESEAIGRVTHELLQTIHPIPWSQIKSILIKHRIWEGEPRHRTKDGQEVIVSARHQLIYSADGIAHVMESNRDITERKRVEAEISRMASILDETQSLAHVGGWELDLIANKLFWTDETYIIHDTTRSSYTPTVETAIAFYTPVSVPVISAAVHDAIEQGKEFFLDLELITAKGRLIWVEVSGKVMREGGRSVKVFGAVKDITERKILEEALRKSNAELEVRVLQRTAELSVINEELLAEIEERKQAESRISRLNRLYSVLSKVNEAIVHIRTPKDLYESVCRIAVEDGLFKMAWIGLLDRDTRLVNPVASYGDGGGYLKDIKICADDVPEGRGPTGKAVFKDRYSISSDIENDPRMLPWKDKLLLRGLRSSAAFPLHASSRIIGALTVYSSEPQFFTDEEIHLFLSLTDDVAFALDAMSTEEKRIEAEEALRRINEDLEKRVVARTADLEVVNKELEAFSYSVSHDLRAPLRHMSGFVELLQKKLGDQQDEKIYKYTTVIAKSSKKMGMLIDDLLAFSKIGRIDLKKRKVSLNTLVRGVVREIKDAAKGRDIFWEIDELPDVYGDQSLLRMVIVNLVSNAVKYTNTRSKIVIQIGCKDEGSEIICSIKDNGVGFDMKHAAKLFGVFQRLHTEDEFEGTGIGLANVKRIISRHGGRVWAEGAVGQGATFYFTLPKDKVYK